MRLSEDWVIALTSTTSPQLTASSSWRGYLRRGGLAIAVSVLLGIVGGVVYTAVAHKKYTATTRVLVTATGIENVAQTSSSRTPNTINLDTEAQLVTSAAVVQGATKLYPPLTAQTYENLVKDIAVSVPPNTTVLQIGFTAPTPRAAQAGANAFATAYLKDRESTAQGSLTRQISNAQGSVTALTTRLQLLSRQAAALADTSTDKSFLLAQIGLIKSQINGVNAQLVSLNTVQVTPGRVVTAASRPSSPSSPSLLLDVVSGFALGLLLGLFLAWLRVRFRRSIRTADDLVHVVDAACLAVLPATDGSATRSAATYRRIALVAVSAMRQPARLTVSSPLLTISASRVAAGVATSLSHGGTTAALLQVHGTEIEVAYPRSISATRVTHADDLVSDSGESLVEAIDRVRGRHAVVVIDVPAATVSADAQTMAAHSDAVLLVVDAGTRSKVVRAALAEFDSVGAPILGTVLVRGKQTVLRPKADADPMRQPSADPPAEPADGRKNKQKDGSDTPKPGGATTSHSPTAKEVAGEVAPR